MYTSLSIWDFFLGLSDGYLGAHKVISCQSYRVRGKALRAAERHKDEGRAPQLNGPLEFNGVNMEQSVNRKAPVA